MKPLINRLLYVSTENVNEGNNMIIFFSFLSYFFSKQKL